MPSCYLPQMIAAQIVRTPDAVAVVDGSRTLTYRDLDERAERLAQVLCDAGVRPDSVVGVYLRRSVDTVVALLGVWKAAAAYLPLDPDYPAERLRWMTVDSGATIVVTAETLADEVSALGGICTISVESTAGNEIGVPITVPPSADRLAYVIYTSGSSGRPKGVAITHGGIGNRVNWTVRTQGFSASDRVLQKTALSFDAAAWEIFAPLVVGGIVVMAPPGVERDPRAMLSAIADYQATILQVVPSVLRLLVEQPGWAACSSLRLVTSAGEPLHAELCHQLLALADVEIWNTYGPTECSIDVSAHRFDRGQARGPVSIGRPIQGIDLRILEEDGALAPAGTAGELCAGGVGLARGYRGQPARTAERFVPDPYGSPGSRLYRTGDRARQRDDGTMEYLGRIDDQVKINGVRVEPDEVATALLACPPVRAAAVVCRPDVRGDNRLVAYVVGVTATELDAVRARLAETLPRHYLPAQFVAMEALPVTPNGKLDRAALPAPAEHGVSDDYTAPADPIEQAVAEAWAELLDVERVSRTDDFFKLGGHSLLLVRLTFLLSERLHREVTVADLYEATTVAEQAVRLRLAASPDAEAAPRAVVDRAALSAGQRRLWFLQRLDPTSTQYLVPIVVDLDRAADLDTFERACQHIVARHAILRTRYEVHGDEPVQVIDAAVAVPVRLVEVAATEAPEEAFGRLADTEAAEPFDLGRGPVLRCAIVPAESDAARALLSVHHIACDGRSVDILRSELRAVYAALADGALVPPMPPAVQYADVVPASDPVTEDRALEFWRGELRDRTPFELPTDRPRPRWWTGHGAIRSFTVPPEAVTPVLEIGQQRGASPYVTLLAAVVTMLARRSGQAEITVGSPVSTRTRPELADVVGFLVNTVVLRNDVAGNPSFLEVLDRVKERSFAAFAHQDVAFERVVDEIAGERTPDRSNPLFQILFEMTSEADALAAARYGWRTTKFDMTLRLAVGADGGLIGVVEYATDLFEPATIDRIGAHLGQTIAEIAAAPQARLDDFAVMSDGEHHAVTTGWNDTAAPMNQDTLHGRIQARAMDPTTAERVAVLFETDALTFAEVDDWSTRIARRLRDSGVGRGDVVAVHLDRSLVFLPALLGVMKAGAAYLPLDPSYPAERLHFMAEDSGAIRTLTEADLQGSRHWPTGPVPELAGPDDVAYVIYTSGSTGRPKGVANTHRGIGNRLDWMTERLHPSESDVVIQKTSAGFDVSVWEIFWGLLVGARTVVARPGGHQDPAYMRAAIERDGVTIAHFVPSMLASFLDAGDLTGCTSLRQIVCSGEELPVELATRCLAALPGVRLDNLYGPTEAAVDVSAYACEPTELANLARVPIGAPVANTQLYVLDTGMRPVAVGRPGELYIGGIQVAPGYVRRPALTAERFLPDPLGTLGGRLYRTGDEARWRSDGTIEYLGRLDSQVKIRGMRVELGEIEAVLRRHDVIRAAAVDLDGQTLIGYVVPTDDATIDLAELRTFLHGQIPDHMVPVRWLILDRLPITASGKLDRRALAARSGQAATLRAAFEAPSGPVEEWIASVWSELLGLPQVGAGDDFFALGGHSLLATRVQLRIREQFGVELPLRDLFESAQLRGLAITVTDAVIDQVATLSDEELLAAVD